MSMCLQSEECLVKTMATVELLLRDSKKSKIFLLTGELLFFLLVAWLSKTLCIVSTTEGKSQKKCVP